MTRLFSRLQKTVRRDSVESIIAPLSRIVSDLQSYAERERQQIPVKHERINVLNLEIDAHEADADRAEVVARRVRELVTQ